MFAEPMWELMSSWFTPPTLLFLLLNFTIATIYVTSHTSPSPPSPSPPSPSHLKSDSTEPLHRTTSVIHRLKSVNFFNFSNHHTSHEPPSPVSPSPSPPSPSHLKPDSTEQLHCTTSVLHRLKSVNFFNPHTSHESPSPVSPSPAPVENETVVNPVEETEDVFDDEVEIGGEKSIDEVYSQLQRSSHNRSKSDMDPSSGAAALKLVKKMKKSASSKTAFGHFTEDEILEARRPATVKESTKTEDEEVDSKADDFINKFKKQLQLQRRESVLRYKNMLGRGANK